MSNLATLLYRQLERGAAGADRIRGAVIGVVTNNKDPEKLARVQVRVPVLGGTDQTWWAPVVSPGAGKNRGWFFIPEVEDEVVVMFEHGNVNHPIVIGALWNGKDAPADKNDGQNERRVIKSRAGSRIVLDDDKKLIILEDGGGKGRITFAVDKNTITVEALAGDICLQAPTGKVAMVSKTATWKAGKDIELTTGSTWQVGTDASGKFKGKSKLSIDGSRVDVNNGGAPSPKAPEASPKEIKDPYGS